MGTTDAGERLLSKSDVELLHRWEDAAVFFRARYVSEGKGKFRFKDYAFREVYGELIKQALRLLPSDPIVLKTDLWNEGVEDGRRLVDCVEKNDLTLVCADISRYVCHSASRLERSRSRMHPIRATLLAPPFRADFDLILDVSTIDHMPKRLRALWVLSEASLLKPNALLLISFDCRLNLFGELYHRLFTRKIYPEWTLAPSELRKQLKASGFDLIREHAIFVAGFFWGTHRPAFPLARLLRHRSIFRLLTRIELSNRSRWLSFVAPQYVMVARKKG